LGLTRLVTGFFPIFERNRMLSAMPASSKQIYKRTIGKKIAFLYSKPQKSGNALPLNAATATNQN